MPWPRLFAAAVLCGVTLAAPTPAQQPDLATVAWNKQGIVARFPAAWSPVQISRDTTVTDQFSGYEWRLVLERGATSWLVAFVIPPDPKALTLRHFRSNEDAVRAGGSRIRRCEPDLLTIRCGRPARGVVRLVDDRLELLVTEARWYLAADSGGASLHLAVRRAGEELWSSTHVLSAAPD